MSLSVNIYNYDKLDKIHVVSELDPSKELAGTEDCRYKLWGSEALRRTGLEIIPSLKNTDVYADGELLPKLEAEVNIIIDQVEMISSTTGYTCEYITTRAGNILEAIQRAKQINGGVVIW